MEHLLLGVLGNQVGFPLPFQVDFPVGRVLPGLLADDRLIGAGGKNFGELFFQLSAAVLFHQNQFLRLEQPLGFAFILFQRVHLNQLVVDVQNGRKSPAAAFLQKGGEPLGLLPVGEQLKIDPHLPARPVFPGFVLFQQDPSLLRPFQHRRGPVVFLPQLADLEAVLFQMGGDLLRPFGDDAGNH